MREHHDHFIDAMMYVMEAKGMKKLPKWKILWYRIKRRLRRFLLTPKP